MTTLPEYWDMLNNFDWFYDFSDDHNVWQRGFNKEQKLKFIASDSPIHAELYSGFRKHNFSGPSYETPKQPKPIRPTE